MLEGGTGFRGESSDGMNGKKEKEGKKGREMSCEMGLFCPKPGDDSTLYPSERFIGRLVRLVGHEIA